MCCVFGKPRRDFGSSCFVNHFSEGRVNENHNVTCSPSLAENDFGCSRIAKENGDGECFFFLLKEGGRPCFILASDKNEKDHKNL